MMVFKNTKLGKFTKGMNVDRRIWAFPTLIILVKEEEPPREIERA